MKLDIRRAELNAVVKTVAFMNGLSPESEEIAFLAARRSPRRAWNCYAAILRSHAIAMSDEPKPPPARGIGCSTYSWWRGRARPPR